MPIFRPKQCLNPLKKISIFRLLKLHVFIAQNRLFLVLEYRKRHFPGLYCLKKKVAKTAIFGPKPWVNPFEILPIFRLFELLVFIAQTGVFSFQNIVTDIFLAHIAKKETCRKMTIIGPKPWVKTFGKMSIFRLFELLVFMAQKGDLSFQNVVKDIFLAFIA